MIERGAFCTGVDHARERMFQRGERFEFGAHGSAFALGALFHFAAGVLPVDLQPEQLLNLGQREAEFLRVLDELNARNDAGRITSHAPIRLFRLRHELAALVKPDGLDMHAGGFGDLTDGKAVCGVYAQHGHGLMGCKSPVGGFNVDHVVDAYND